MTRKNDRMIFSLSLLFSLPNEPVSLLLFMPSDDLRCPYKLNIFFSLEDVHHLLFLRFLIFLLFLPEKNKFTVHFSCSSLFWIICGSRHKHVRTSLSKSWFWDKEEDVLKEGNRFLRKGKERRRFPSHVSMKRDMMNCKTWRAWTIDLTGISFCPDSGQYLMKEDWGESSSSLRLTT